MNLILFDDDRRNYLLPFTHTRPVADIRCGIYSMRERWEHLFHTSSSSLTEPYLQEVFPLRTAPENLYVNGGLFGTAELAEAISALKPGQVLVHEGDTIAFCTRKALKSSMDTIEYVQALDQVPFSENIRKLEQVWDIFSRNADFLKLDFDLITRGRLSEPLPDSVTAVCPEGIFIEQGAILNPCIINASSGPVYIGRNAEVMDGCLIRGALALCDHAVLKMGSKIYGATTIGPGSKIGGEVSNVIFFNNSNKGHDGFLGNAVIGDWCNLGADTNCSNLKNNYDEIKVWSEYEQKSVKTGLQFFGLLMGDHAKCGINTMFNTGTIVGVSSNIFGANFPPKFIPSFSWGGSEHMETYQLDKALATADRMMERRGRSLSEAEIRVLTHLFEESAKDRDLLH